MNPRKNSWETSAAVSCHGLRLTRAFTVTELLVVLDLTVLLTSVLWPALLQTRQRARTVICRGRLQQWGLAFSLVLQERETPILNVVGEDWQPFWLPYCDRRGDLFLCPAAMCHDLNRNDPSWPARAAVGCGSGSKSTAWKLATRTPAALEPGLLLGSYGVNNSGLVFLDGRIVRGRRFDRSTIPVFLDCCFHEAQARSTDGPPAFDGELASPDDIKGCCIDRHDGGINGLFLDWSVRKIGLKELWTLHWSPFFDRHGPWTKAGGVQTEDWPLWMRAFKDY